MFISSIHRLFFSVTPSSKFKEEFQFAAFFLARGRKGKRKEEKEATEDFFRSVWHARRIAAKCEIACPGE